MAITLRNTAKNWEMVYIKDICKSITDCVNKTALAVDYQTPYKMIRTNNVKNGHIDLSDIKYVTKEVFETLDKTHSAQERGCDFYKRSSFR